MSRFRSGAVHCTALLLTVLLISCLMAGCRSRPPDAATGAPASARPVVAAFTEELPPLPFRHVNGGRQPITILQTIGSGGALLDYNDDGRLDLFLVNNCWLNGHAEKDQPRAALYRNDTPPGGGPWRFTDVTAAAGLARPCYGIGAAAADYDGDGDVDLYMTAYGGNALYRNNGDGTFTDVTGRSGVRTGGFSTSAAWADVDGDGWLDLFVCRYLKFGPASRQLCPYRGVLMGCNPRIYPGEEGVLYRNNGDGTFADVTRAAGVAVPGGKSLGCLFTDYDGDGRQDLYVANDGMPNCLFHNEGGGRFRNVALAAGVAYDPDGNAQGSMGVDSGDFDGDGRFDLFVTNYQDELDGLYRNDGSAGFTDAARELGLAVTRPWLSFGCGFLDADNDADRDLFIASGHVMDTIARAEPEQSFPQPRHLLENDSGRYIDVSAASGPALTRPEVGRGAALGDLDNDGDTDLLVTNNGGAPVLLRSGASTRGHWLPVRLIGRRPNTFGIGARVTVTAAGRRQVAEVRAGGSYASSSDPRLHFGLGAAASIESVQVRWPDGYRQTVPAPPIDRELVVRRP